MHTNTVKHWRGDMEKTNLLNAGFLYSGRYDKISLTS